MLIEVTQNTLFSAITSGRVKPHEALVIDGDHIGNLAGLLGGARYLVEQELIEDEPTSDEEDEVEGAVEGVVEGTTETVEGTVEAPQESKAEVKIPYKKPEVYKYDTLKDARNPDGTPVLPVHKAVSLNDSGMTAREIADKYSIRDARSVAQAIRQYRKRYHRGKEPDATAILMATHRAPAKKQEGDGDEND
jgi:hypothetical protein